jgi:hypothetical protein
MRHLNSLACIVLLSFCLYFSIHCPVRAAYESGQLSNKLTDKTTVLNVASIIKAVDPDSLPNGEWQVLLNESFESAWPSYGWSVADLSDDGYDRIWGSDEYRPHTPSLKAAWPARSGRNGRNPTSKNNDYFNNLDTRMVYGPFDLSDASTLEISFWMWWQTEANHDYIILEVSRDNQTFAELGRWHGTYSEWQFIDVLTNDYALDSSVWVAWRFTSNASTAFDGPWVDDILLRELLGNFVDVQGTLSYYDRYNNPIGAAFTTVELYDYDIGGDGDDFIARVYTEPDGSFYFNHIYNVDDDEYPYQGRDLYVVWKTVYDDSVTSRHQVENLDGQIYQWQSEIKYNVTDPIIEFNKEIQSGDPELGALWIFRDIFRSWNYVYNSTVSPNIDPGSVRVKWEYLVNCYLLDEWICSSFFFTNYIDSFIFIRYDQVFSDDVATHEIGHAFMYNTSQWWWPIPTCWYHEPWQAKDVSCAWSEGWADFFPLAVNGDQCFDYGRGPCGLYGDAFYDLEIPSWDYLPWGDDVQGHVSGAIYDLYDDDNEGYDSSTYGFDPIADIVFNQNNNSSLFEFWEQWKYYIWGDNHDPVRSIYQNTIDYDLEPFIYPPDKTVFRNSPPMYNIIDLWEYSSDPESSVDDLFYYLTYINGNCGITLENHWINIAPLQGWIGSCLAVVEVTDTIKSTSNFFWVYVIDPSDIDYLPFVKKAIISAAIRRLQ